jgi:integrase
VFCREDGRHLDPDLFSRTFLGLAAEAGLPRIRLHDLRHTHASIGLNAGVPLKVISERLGHADPEYTMRQYIHALPGMQKEAAAKIASIVLPQS